jgi:hypothetical protein
VIAVRRAASSRSGNSGASWSRSSRTERVARIAPNRSSGSSRWRYRSFFSTDQRTRIARRCSSRSPILGGLQLAHPRAALVDDEERDDVVTWQPLGYALDVFGERRRDVGPSLLGQLDALVSGRVRLDAVIVEELRERPDRLLDRRPLVLRSPGFLLEDDERADQLDHVLDGQLVDSHLPEPRSDPEDAGEGRAVHVLRAGIVPW